MKEINFRPLTANEIECRVGNSAKDGSGFFLLLYKNARVDQNILDETFGVWNWQCRYYQVKNTMVCSIGVYNEERKEWIWKDNGGDDDSQMEQVKSELSDSFKRAAFCLGIGRELYYSPKIYIKSGETNSKFEHYSVKVIEYDDKKRITRLAIINDKTKEVVFLYGKEQKVSQNVELTPKNTYKTEKGTITKADNTYINAYINTLSNDETRKKVWDWIDKNYGTMNIELLSEQQGKEIVAKFKK